MRSRVVVPADTVWCTLSVHINKQTEEEGREEVLICILFIGSSIETAVKLSGFTFQGYPLNLDVCK